MTFKVDREAIAKEWAEDGFGCDLWTDAAGARWENFEHETDERVMLVEGELEFEIAGKIIRPKVGELIIIPAGIRHSVRNKSSKQNRWLYGYKGIRSQ